MHIFNKFFNRFNTTYNSFKALTSVIELAIVGSEKECLSTLEMIDEKVDEYKENHIKDKDKKSIKVDKVLEGQEETIIRRMNTELCTNIFNLIGSEVYNQIVNGEYGYKDE